MTNTPRTGKTKLTLKLNIFKPKKLNLKQARRLWKRSESKLNWKENGKVEQKCELIQTEVEITLVGSAWSLISETAMEMQTLEATGKAHRFVYFFICSFFSAMHSRVS